MSNVEQAQAAYVASLQRAAGNIAAQLHSVADTIAREAASYGGRDNTRVTAAIVSALTNSPAQAGTYLTTLVREAAELDRLLNSTGN